MKKFYFRITIKMIFIMIIIEIISIFVASRYELPTAIFWYYVGAFINATIAGTVFFKFRALWEIERNPYYTNFPKASTPFTSYLLRTSWVIVLLFFISFALSFTNFFNAIGVPKEFHFLFRWPAFGSFFVQAILTFGGWVIRDLESEEIILRRSE